MKYFTEVRGLRKGYGIDELRVLVKDLFNELREHGQFTEFLGYYCVDEGEVPGTAGHDPGRTVRRDTGRKDIWPVEPD
ncbi:MAG TPA: hypothetical protein VJP76_07805, partial [Candidatus Tumulicola sp.]|nr:hypothetical protein [Candidatus Tumulicola sp.]